jgi:hypothetical protein
VTSRLSLKRNDSLSRYTIFGTIKHCWCCVSHFSTNTQAIGILLHVALVRLAADDTAVVTNMDANVAEDDL